jgi:hypothetical protein
MNVTIIGSGPEDIGANIAAEARNRAAELAALAERLDRDAIISAALNHLYCSALGSLQRFELPTTAENLDVWLSSYVASVTGRKLETPAEHCIALARRELSPTVR